MEVPVGVRSEAKRPGLLIGGNIVISLIDLGRPISNRV